MKKILMTLAVILCCVMTTTVVNAQILQKQAQEPTFHKMKQTGRNLTRAPKAEDEVFSYTHEG